MQSDPSAPPPACPLCGTTGSVLKVSEINEVQARATGLPGAGRGSPPPVNRPATDADWQSLYRIFGALMLGLLAAGLLFVSISTLRADAPGGAVGGVPRRDESLVEIVMGLLLALSAARLLISRKARLLRARVRTLDQEYLPTLQRAQERWDNLYYCDTHSIIFLRGTAAYLSTGDIWSVLYT